MDRSKLRRMACAVVVAACVGLSGSGAPLYAVPLPQQAIRSGRSV